MPYPFKYWRKWWVRCIIQPNWEHRHGLNIKSYWLHLWSSIMGNRKLWISKSLWSLWVISRSIVMINILGSWLIEYSIVIVIGRMMLLRRRGLEGWLGALVFLRKKLRSIFWVWPIWKIRFQGTSFRILWVRSFWRGDCVIVMIYIIL